MPVVTKPRTSISHPLMIASVSPGADMGRIGITFCPGKKQAGAMTGSWNRDLDLDVAAIADWGAVCVITLIEDHEIDVLGVHDLRDAVRRHHMDWLHLPIRDVSVPDAALEQAWCTIGPRIRSILTAGFDVVVHCKGGLGRAGTIAARMLIDCGVDPEVALRNVRAVRTGAVETAAQEQYVLQLQPVPEANAGGLDETDRAIGALLGLAVGDAIGTTLEFSARDTKPMVTDMLGGGPFGLKPGQWTDDTAMALALADSLTLAPQLDANDLMRRFVDWHRNGTYSCTGRCFDIGITTRQALSRFEHSGEPIAGSTDPMSAGNGSLMRLSPVAIRHWRNPAELSRVAALQSQTTHAAPEAVDACMAFAQILASAIRGDARDEVLNPTLASASCTIADIVGGSWRGKRRDEIKSSGYVAHSLEAAIWCVARTADFRSAVLIAANLGDDADTVAAITGQLAGALYGASGIPAEWLEKLAWRERLELAARVLLA